MIITNNNTPRALARLFLLFIIATGSMLLLSFGQDPKKLAEEESVFQYGKASYYGHPFIGRKTANGEIFTENLYTCAHKSLPFGTKLKVTNLSNGRAIIVRVNDRGPYVKQRIVDLSLKGAKELGLMSCGVANVSIEIVNSKFSSLGNVSNMEKVYIGESYAYIDRDDVPQMTKALNHLEGDMSTANVTKTSEIDYTKPQTPTETYTKEGTSASTNRLIAED